MLVTIVVNVCEKMVGLVADGVSDVLALKRSDILPLPDFGGASFSANARKTERTGGSIECNEGALAPFQG